jgi:pyruvate formate lyase activating enzyme
LDSRSPTEIAWSDVRAFLARREGLLDAVVFSGGEPLAQRGLAQAMEDVRRMGFRVGLHTSGAYSNRLAEVLPLVDWVGLDIKAPFSAYTSITGVPGSAREALASTRLVVDSGVACEFRTTVHPRLLAPQAVERLAEEIARLGARHYALQEFRGKGCSDAALLEDSGSSWPDSRQLAMIARKFESFEVRRRGLG